MEQARKRRPSPGLIVAMIALVAAMSGAAVALPGKNSVGSGDIKDDAVRSKHLKAHSVKGSDVQDDALKGKQVFEDKLDAVPEAKTVQSVRPFGDSFERVTATDGATDAAAQAAAPRIPLASKGQLSVYGKCFRNSVSDELFGIVYIETSADGAIFDSNNGDEQEGGPSNFLDTTTPEDDRELYVGSTVGTGADDDDADDGWQAMAIDGTGLSGQVGVALKNGDLPGGNGVYGEGNICLFGGNAVG